MILVANDRLARLDLGEAPSRPVMFSWQAERLPGQMPEQAVEAALVLNGRCAKAVWVLCEDLWTQSLSLSAQSVRGLDDRQLRRVLAFELESLSGLGADQSQVAMLPLAAETEGARQTYWVIQAPNAELHQLQSVIRHAGGRLKGLLHPSGPPGSAAMPAGEGEGLERWLALQAQRLDESPGSMAIITPPRVEHTAGQRVGISLAMAAAALALCLSHGLWMNGRLADVSKELKDAERPRQQVAQLDQRLAQAREEVRRLTTGRENRASIDLAAALAAPKRRTAALLAALNASAHDSRVVTTLKTDPQGGQTVEGLCLTPESADDLAVALSRKLAGSGWEVRGAQKNVRIEMPEGGPWEFKILLVPAARPTEPKSVTTTSLPPTGRAPAGGKP